MSQKIVFIDSNSIGSFHEVFNLGFLVNLLKQEVAQIVYFSDKSSINAIRELANRKEIKIDTKKISHKSLPLLSGQTTYSILLRMILGVFINTFLFLKYRKHTVVFSNLNPLFAVVFNFLASTTNKNYYFVCHGELEYLIQNPPFYKPLRLYKFFMKVFFSTKAKNIKLILIGSTIKENLMKVVPTLTNNELEVMKHPYLFDKNQLEELNKKRISIGTVGSISESKGFKEVVNLSKLLNQSSRTGPIQIKVIGKHLMDVRHYKYLDFISKYGEIINYTTYNEEVSKLDIVIFCYSPDSYSLTASGAIFDAINHNKVIVALKNDYFSSVFKDAGDLGYLCADVSEMQEKIFELINNPFLITKFDVNIKKAKSLYDLQNVYLKIT